MAKNMRSTKVMGFSEAVDDALRQAMAEDERIIIIGEDVHALRAGLYVRFGADRVRPAPISEAAFLGAAVGAALGGLRPVAEIMLVDFIGVAVDALLNQAAKIKAFTGGRWEVPLVVRASCGGGYGDGGQHEQSLWGWLAHIPGLAVAVPSTPADAGGLMLGALDHGRPVVFLEHKLLSESWLEAMGRGGRRTVSFPIPPDGARGAVPKRWEKLPLGRAALRRGGKDLTMVSLGVGVHRCLEAAVALAEERISAGVVDLRTVAPLDKALVLEELSKTGRLLVVDEDYKEFGLSGELAALALEAGLRVRFGRVCTEETIPYARDLEEAVLPSTARIIEAARRLRRSR
jgi:pyruvate dehydrogenase E1 component beta subunit